MHKHSFTLGVLLAVASGASTAQSAPTIEALQASAKAYAGTDWAGTYTRLCIPGVTPETRVMPSIDPSIYPSGDVPVAPGSTPPRANWYSPPAKIGDNLYFLGTRNHNTYALVSRRGEIILIDGNFEYATEDEIHKGLQFLGLDSSKVRYAVYAHAHADHDGGAHLTEAAFPGITIVYGEGDWPSVLARSGPHATRFGPENDGVDGRVIRVGDVSLQIVTMPGHTPGTLSFLFEFKDGGKPIRVAYPGGTAISFTSTDAAFYDGYIASARKFGRAAAAYGATALLSNHTEFDNAYFKAHTAATLRDLRDDDGRGKRDGRHARGREQGDGIDVPNRYLRAVPNPFFVGQREVMNYMAVVELCAMAAKVRAIGAP